MIYVEVPQKQTVELGYDENSGTYPQLYFSEDGVRVLKLQLQPDVADRVRQLLEQVAATRSEREARYKAKQQSKATR